MDNVLLICCRCVLLEEPQQPREASRACLQHLPCGADERTDSVDHDGNIAESRIEVTTVFQREHAVWQAGFLSDALQTPSASACKNRICAAACAPREKPAGKSAGAVYKETACHLGSLLDGGTLHELPNLGSAELSSP